ncbi:MAG: GNAT family N-acetyltransferase [Acidimicrobiia bacterium]|nr:GNAT family N-acetyltransferase [Acidimicrobiia bacterium]
MSTVQLRPATPEDAATIHALIRKSEIHDREPLVTPLGEIVELFDDPHLDPARDVRLGFVDDRAVAWGWVWHHPSGERLERAYLFGTVDPDQRGQGIGRVVFAWQLNRARSILNSYDRRLPRFIRTAAWDWLTGAHHLYERFGFRPVRWFDELLRPLDAAAEVPEIPGVGLGAWPADRTEEIRLLHNQAFADHWGSGAIDQTAWEKRLTGHGVRLDLSVIALREGRVVGYCLNEVFPDDEELLGRRDGWIGMLGVDRDHRKRGIASALIGASMAEFRRAGLTHASIGVDADSPTGANHLYYRLGFRSEKRSITHQLELSDSPDG